MILQTLCVTVGLKNLTNVAYNLTNLKKLNPGIGVNYIYYPGSDGTLKKINLNVDNATAAKLKLFYDTEKKIDAVNDNLPKPAIISTSSNNPIKYNGKKFNFTSKTITFTLYTRNYTAGINMKNFPFAQYNVTKKTKVVTHGFLSSGTADICIKIKNNYLNVSDLNVIVLDWGTLAGNIIYPITAITTGYVADYCSQFLGYLIKSVGIAEEDIHLIGHSLGAHVVGFCGKRLLRAGFKNLTRCTGLDPALPLFSIIHINSKDCKFVDIIHTDSGMLGNGAALGDVDFYPNGGSAPQPGCENKSLLSVNSCSHSMSWKFYAETILDGSRYVAICHSSNLNAFKAPMGAPTLPNTRGTCKLDTD